MIIRKQAIQLQTTAITSQSIKIIQKTTYHLHHTQISIVSNTLQHLLLRSAQQIEEDSRDD